MRKINFKETLIKFTMVTYSDLLDLISDLDFLQNSPKKNFFTFLMDHEKLRLN